MFTVLSAYDVRPVIQTLSSAWELNNRWFSPEQLSTQAEQSCWFTHLLLINIVLDQLNLTLTVDTVVDYWSVN